MQSSDFLSSMIAYQIFNIVYKRKKKKQNRKLIEVNKIECYIDVAKQIIQANAIFVNRFCIHKILFRSDPTQMIYCLCINVLLDRFFFCRKLML